MARKTIVKDEIKKSESDTDKVKKSVSKQSSAKKDATKKSEVKTDTVAVKAKKALLTENLLVKLWLIKIQRKVLLSLNLFLKIKM